MLDIISSCSPVQYQEKLMMKTWENYKKPHFGYDLDPLGTNSSHQFFFFFKNLASSVTRCHGQLSSCTISEKTNDPILRKLSDGRMDGRTDGQKDRQSDTQADRQTDRQMDESDFIGCCLTNVERPKQNKDTIYIEARTCEPCCTKDMTGQHSHFSIYIYIYIYI